MFFDVYYFLAWLLILFETLVTFQCYRNYRFVMVKHKKQRRWHKKRVLLIIPCKGLDPAFDANISSFFAQDYANYKLWFVVEDKSDPAYASLSRLKDKLADDSNALEVRIQVAGKTHGRSQKLHNLLYCYRNRDDDIDILAFADSDICVRPDWLSHLIWPLRQQKVGASTGYRWFVPENNNLPTLILASLNAKVAQMLGNTRFNKAWGGSMAIPVSLFAKLQLDQIWSKTLSDDLSLSRAVRKAAMKTEFVPACLVPSYETVNWPRLFEFGRRQFLITRIYAPKSWLIGLGSSTLAVLGIWGGLAAAVWAALTNQSPLALFIAVPLTFILAQFLQAVLRQRMIAKVLPEQKNRMIPAMVLDIAACAFMSAILMVMVVGSAFGRTIRWRGIRYKIQSPTDIVIDDNPAV